MNGDRARTRAREAAESQLYERLRAVNPWLPPPEHVLRDSLSLAFEGSGTLPLLTLTAEIVLPNNVDNARSDRDAPL